jgi:hypothetical protein
MPLPQHDVSHLSGLIEAALDEAKRLGADAANVGATLAEALAQVQNIEAHGGHPDQGLSPRELTTDNDL